MEPISGLARFWRFWDEDLDGGTLPFKVRNQQIDGQPLADEDGNPIKDEDGATILIAAYWVCRFEGVPEEVPLDDPLWQISYQLSVFA